MMDGTDVSRTSAATKAAEGLRSFDSRSEEAAVRLLRTAGLLQVKVARVLRHYGISPVGYDILVVLDGAGGSLRPRQIADAISTASPDLTRLLQRLELQGLVRREKHDGGRRTLRVTLTDDGAAMLVQVAGPVGSLYKQVLGRLEKSDRKQLLRVLRKLEGRG